MSAFMVSDQHINAIVSYVRLRTAPPPTATRAGPSNFTRLQQVE